MRDDWQVTIGGVAAEITHRNTEHLDLVVTLDTLGAHDLEVVAPNGDTASLPGALTVLGSDPGSGGADGMGGDVATGGMASVGGGGARGGGAGGGSRPAPRYAAAATPTASSETGPSPTTRRSRWP